MSPSGVALDSLRRESGQIAFDSERGHGTGRRRSGPDSAFVTARPARPTFKRRRPTTHSRTTMRTSSRVSPSPKPSGPRPIRSDRRRRTRLRELCDEVLASFRLASDRDPISEEDRAEAMTLLARVAPHMGSASRR